MKQAIELFNSKSYVKAEKLFLNSGAPDRAEAMKYLFFISKALNRPDQKERYNSYLQILGEQASYEKIYDFHAKYGLELQAKNFTYILEALWALGQVEEFSKRAKLVWLEIIERKLYAFARIVFKTVQAKNPLLLNNYFSYLLYLIEIEDTDEIKTLVPEISSLICDKWERVKLEGLSQASCLAKLIALLETYKDRDAQVEEHVLELRLLLSLKTGKPLGKRTLIEHLIIFKNRPGSLVALLEGNLLKNPDKLREVLAGADYHESMKAIAPKLKKLLRPAKKYVINSDPEPVREEGDFLETLSPIEVLRETESVRSKPLPMCESEKAALARIKAQDPELCDTENAQGIIHSLMGVGFYEAALEVMETTGPDPRNYYVKCHALYELGRYHLLSDFAQELLCAEVLSSEERVPFLHMLASAQYKMGQRARCLKTLAELVKIDPNFRNTQELLNFAKA